VPPDLGHIAAQICNNPQSYDTANREMNPYSGRLTYIEAPQLDTTAAILIASNEVVKPLLVGIREQPTLQSSWFDPNAANGGMYFFKFYARYEVHYSDWRLAYQIQT